MVLSIIAQERPARRPYYNAQNAAQDIPHAMSARWRSWGRSTTAARLTWVMLAAPAFLALWYIHTYGVNGAHWDHLSNAELFDRFHTGTLTAEYLFRPHLEHIKVVPRLMALSLGLATRFNNLAEMYLQWALLCGTAAVLVWTAARTGASHRPSIAFVPIPLILFNLRQHESMLVGDGMITYLSIAGSTAVICLLSLPRSATRLALAIAAAVVASFSHVSALLLWPLGAVMLLLVVNGVTTVSRTPAVWRQLAWWLAAGTVVAVVYAWRWTGVDGALQYAAAYPGRALEYAVAAAAAPFESSWRWQRRLGAAVVLLEAVVLAVAAIRVRDGRRVPIGAWLVAFTVGCRLLMAAGRAVGAAGQDVPSRYAAFAVLGHAGLYAAALEWTAVKNRVSRVLLAATVLVLAVGTGRGYVEGWRAGPGERDMRLRIVQLLESTPLQDDATIERWLYPYAPHARDYARTLGARRLNVFARPHPDPASLPRSGGLEFWLDSVNGEYVPPGATVELRRSDLVQLSGWAFEKSGSRLLSRAYVRVGHDRRIPGAYGIHRPDVARVHGVADTAGFSATFSAAALPAGEHVIAMDFVTGDGARVIMTPTLLRIIVQ